MLTPLSLLIIAVVLIVALVFAFAKREAAKHGTKTGQEFVGICKSAVETASEKEQRKDAALALLGEQDPSTNSGYKELSNAEIRTALDVASRTAVRYLDELEREGLVVQVGRVGHAVTYRLK